MVEPETGGGTIRKKGIVRLVRWVLYSAFFALMLFIATCLAVGIVSNLKWRYADLDIPVNRPEALAEMSELEWRDCLSALESLHSELRRNVDRALEGAVSRTELLHQWREWNQGWRQNFERVGFSCRLTEFRYDDQPVLGLLAGIYRILDNLQLALDRMVRAFVLENARTLLELHQLLERARGEMHTAR